MCAGLASGKRPDQLDGFDPRLPLHFFGPCSGRHAACAAGFLRDRQVPPDRVL